MRPLWYLNVRSPAPYRWVCARATLCLNALILAWIVPGEGRAVVTLDLVNCTGVRGAPSPLHQDAIDDIGSIAARAQSAEENVGEGERLADFLCPFQLIDSDELERLGAENAREREMGCRTLVRFEYCGRN
jgi:hypothetical protein